MPPAKWGRRPPRNPAKPAAPAAGLDSFVRPKPKLKRLNALIPVDLHTRVKVGCALEGRGMTDVVTELLEQRFPEEP